MYRILLRAILVLSVLELARDGARNFEFDTFNIRQAPELTKKLVKVNWRPISVFPEEARKF